MGISRDIGQDLFGSGEGGLGVDHPFGFAGGSEVTQESASVTERLQGAEEGEFSGVKSLLQSLQEQPAVETGEHPDRQEEVGPAGDPTSVVCGEPATGDDAMQLRMMEQCLSPGVENGKEAEFGAEVLRIGADRAQGLGGGMEAAWNRMP